MDALTKPELLTLLAAARSHRERDFLMILVAYCHGLRASEVVGITRQNIKDGCLDLQRLKGSKRTKQPLLKHDNPLLNERVALSAFLEKARGNQKLFPITRKQFGRIVARHATTAELPEHKRHPHMLKHTMGTEIYQKTKDVKLLQAYLGHKRPASSLIYAAAAEDEEASTSIQKLVLLES